MGFAYYDKFERSLLLPLKLMTNDFLLKFSLLKDIQSSKIMSLNLLSMLFKFYVGRYW